MADGDMTEKDYDALIGAAVRRWAKANGPSPNLTCMIAKMGIIGWTVLQTDELNLLGLFTELQRLFANEKY